MVRAAALQAGRMNARSAAAPAPAPAWRDAGRRQYLPDDADLTRMIEAVTQRRTGEA